MAEFLLFDRWRAFSARVLRKDHLHLIHNGCAAETCNTSSIRTRHTTLCEPLRWEAVSRSSKAPISEPIGDRPFRQPRATGRATVVGFYGIRIAGDEIDPITRRGT